MKYIYYSNELYHHGILGQKWGVRRFQNEDGSLTIAGKKRYGNYYGDKNSFTASNGVKVLAPKNASVRVGRKILSTKAGNTFQKGNIAYHKKLGNKNLRKSLDKERIAMNEAQYAHEKAKNPSKKTIKEHWDNLDPKKQKAIKVGAAVVGAAVLAIGANQARKYILSENSKLYIKAGNDAVNTIMFEGNLASGRISNMYRDFGLKGYDAGDMGATAKHLNDIRTKSYVDSIRDIASKKSIDPNLNKLPLATKNVVKNKLTSTNPYNKEYIKTIIDFKDAMRKQENLTKDSLAYEALRQKDNLTEFQKTINKARASGVPEDAILKSYDDINEYFKLFTKANGIKQFKVR